MLSPAGLFKSSEATAPAAGSGLRLCLRSVTAQAHARLDRQLGSLDLAALHGYRQFLEINAAALLPLETSLAAADVARLLPDWDMRSRTAAILDDLACVDGHADPLPPPAPLDAGGVLGTLYVLEGSRLGARVLLNAIKHSPDARVLHATAFLRHGAGQHFWPSFLAILDSDHSARHESSAIDGAIQAFAMFERAAARVFGPNFAGSSFAGPSFAAGRATA
ncbi:biliverdin-producing heme oxygenase [Rhodoplanes sp. Z2-YC6860]|uniref:biliverdin-producing heme oxygenase n=1 Tax=Rhodoplanes sp. Z2-YC6860 TaxID=674703 RepID=UPI00078B4D53|nr:biliverdin-producing heme oxygenase [Rhodoplanes sp. Z2-YC6860]AMN38981.1 heme oxygenase [Rhodoplanes sp. Z2-YC6860]